MIDLYDNIVIGYTKKLELNNFGGYTETVDNEESFKVYIEDINDTSKYGDFGISQYFDIKLIVSKTRIKNYNTINYIDIAGVKYRVIKANKYKLGKKEHIEFLVGQEVSE